MRIARGFDCLIERISALTHQARRQRSTAYLWSVEPVKRCSVLVAWWSGPVARRGWARTVEVRRQSDDIDIVIVGNLVSLPSLLQRPGGPGGHWVGQASCPRW